VEFVIIIIIHMLPGMPLLLHNHSIIPLPFDHIFMNLLCSNCIFQMSTE